ncbi:MAG: hypothetical protein LAP38_04415 [Acidobacteriia bacterium]|nr:hypothetical protein [Terriglobia bacterium]
MEHSNNGLRNDDLDGLFAQYKAALPDPEASANFMPELWRKIEGRQSVLVRVKRLTQIFVATAAAICLLFAILLQVPSRTELRGNYVDILAEAQPAENLAAMGIVPRDSTEVNLK